MALLKHSPPLSMREIGNRVGVSKDTVNRILVGKHQWVPRGRERKRQLFLRLTDFEKDDLRRRAEWAGMTLQSYVHRLLFKDTRELPLTPDAVLDELAARKATNGASRQGD